jgi:hypothetical protein
MHLAVLRARPPPSLRPFDATAHPGEFVPPHGKLGAFGFSRFYGFVRPNQRGSDCSVVSAFGFHVRILITPRTVAGSPS